MSIDLFPDRLTRDSQVVSLEIPGFPATLSGFLDFFVCKQKNGKSKKSFFWISGTKIRFRIILIYMTSILHINPYFRAPSPLKPLKSSPRYQNLPGELLTAHSDHRGRISDPIYLQKYFCLFVWFGLFEFF